LVTLRGLPLVLQAASGDGLVFDPFSLQPHCPLCGRIVWPRPSRPDRSRWEMIAPQVDEIKATTGVNIKTVTADAGHGYAKVNGALERRGIGA